MNFVLGCSFVGYKKWKRGSFSYYTLEFSLFSNWTTLIGQVFSKSWKRKEMSCCTSKKVEKVEETDCVNVCSRGQHILAFDSWYESTCKNHWIVFASCSLIAPVFDCLFVCILKESGGIFPAQNDPGGNRAGKTKTLSLLCVFKKCCANKLLFSSVLSWGHRPFTLHRKWQWF